MSKKHKKEQHEEEVGEAWLLPYADLLTLLLALFIVLFSMSSIDARKFDQMAQTFSSAFDGGISFFDYTASTQPEYDTSQIGPVEDELSENKYENLDETKGLEDFLEEMSQQFAEDLKELAEIQDNMMEYIESKGLTGQFETTLTDEGLLIRIEDQILFDPGSARIKSDYKYIATEIADVLVMTPPRNIIISGHTDNVPIGDAPFESNWELSVMRAVNFMKLLLDNDELEPDMLSAKGFGEYQPVASNDTAAGRAQNRRVEILIMPNTVNLDKDEIVKNLQ